MRWLVREGYLGWGGERDPLFFWIIGPHPPPIMSCTGNVQALASNMTSINDMTPPQCIYIYMYISIYLSIFRFSSSEQGPNPR